MITVFLFVIVIIIPITILLIKADLLDDELKMELAKEIEHAFDDIPHVFISSIAQQGLLPLKDLLWNTLNEKVEG